MLRKDGMLALTLTPDKMKVLAVAVFAVIGLTCVGSLNHDELRDQRDYAVNRRSKRALCGAAARPPVCRSCSCSSGTIGSIGTLGGQIIFGKRVLPFGKCSGANYKLCCQAPVISRAAQAASAKSQASSLLHLFGKRAVGDNQFKKPSVDLIFLIDDSGSIAPAQFSVAREGAATLSQSLCPHKFGSGKGEKQVSVVLFSTTASTVLTYEQSQKGAGYVEDTILGLRQRSGGTATADGIRHVREKVLTQPGSRLNDPDTATIVFVVTDGRCNSRCNSLAAEAEKLRGAGPGVQVFAFGVGEADCDELELIKGKEAGKVFELPDYNFFEKIAIAVKEQMANSTNTCIN